MPIVRKSLFRHVFGQPYKRDKIYESIPISRTSTDNNMCAVNPKFVAIIAEASGGGSFLVLPLEKYGRIDINTPRVCGHKQNVLDIQWSPHNDNIIASCSEDNTVKVWEIPDEGLEEPMVDALHTLCGHQKKVMAIQWNPAAQDILLSFALDEPLLIWDVGTEELLISIECHPSSIFSASWSPGGDLIGTSCKDKKFRIIDARTGDVKQEGPGFDGAKPQKIQMLKDNQAFTVGASKRGERQYALYNTKDMSKPIVEEGVDQANNIFNIFYDEDLSMIYLAAKGDCKLLYYEITDEDPYVHFLQLYQPKESAKGMGFMPKRGLNVNEHEVARIYRLRDRGVCEPTSMIVPRKSELFQSDIYPPCAAEEPAMTSDEWISGANKARKDFEMEGLFKGGNGAMPTAKRSARLGRGTTPAASHKTEPAAPTPAVHSAPKAVSKPAPVRAEPPRQETRHEVRKEESQDQKKQIEELMAEVAKLKATVKEQDERITTLEAKGEVNGN